MTVFCMLRALMFGAPVDTIYPIDLTEKPLLPASRALYGHCSRDSRRPHCIRLPHPLSNFPSRVGLLRHSRGSFDVRAATCSEPLPIYTVVKGRSNDRPYHSDYILRSRSPRNGPVP